MHLGGEECFVFGLGVSHFKNSESIVGNSIIIAFSSALFISLFTSHFHKITEYHKAVSTHY